MLLFLQENLLLFLNAFQVITYFLFFFFFLERVSKCVEKVLLPLWFDHAKNNFVTMLKFLDVETSTETSFLVLQILFK